MKLLTPCISSTFAMGIILFPSAEASDGTRTKQLLRHRQVKRADKSNTNKDRHKRCPKRLQECQEAIAPGYLDTKGLLTVLYELQPSLQLDFSDKLYLVLYSASTAFGAESLEEKLNLLSEAEAANLAAKSSDLVQNIEKQAPKYGDIQEHNIFGRLTDAASLDFFDALFYEAAIDFPIIGDIRDFVYAVKDLVVSLFAISSTERLIDVIIFLYVADALVTLTTKYLRNFIEFLSRRFNDSDWQDNDGKKCFAHLTACEVDNFVAETGPMLIGVAFGSDGTSR